MHLTTLSEIDPFGERQTGTQRQKRVPMPSRHLNDKTRHYPIKPSRTSEKAFATKGGCYE
jgi:hypothetical protein